MARRKVSSVLLFHLESELMQNRVNAVAPGAVDTEQFRKECKEDPEQFWLHAQAT